MEKKDNKKRRIWRNLLVGFLLTLLVLGFGFFLYVNDYYKAEDIALAVMDTGEIYVEDSCYVLKGRSTEGIIFYPGAKVETMAYLPLMQQLQEVGFTCVLVEMPFHLAIFHKNAADQVLAMDLPVDTWYVAGHSLGGAMASAYAAQNPEKIQGLILLGAYIYGDYPPQNTLTIYGSYNDNLEEKFTYTENILCISGGNHAKFGNYGIQKGDPEGDITAQEQQKITVDAIVEFVGQDW